MHALGQPGRCLCLVLAGSMIGCAPSATEGGFESANPAARAYAIEAAVRDQNPDALPWIVESLSSDDPMVCMVAAEALMRLTGQTIDYRHYDSDLDRREAADRWAAAISQAPALPVPDSSSGAGP